MVSSTTETSSLTSDADLTAIHAQAHLSFNHQSRRMENGFLIDSPRLQGYCPHPPGHQGPKSWVWSHGEFIAWKTDGSKWFLCRFCWDKPAQSIKTVIQGNTTLISRHLRKHGYNKDGTRVQTTQSVRKEEQQSIIGSLKRQSKSQLEVFDAADFQNTFLKWVVYN